MNCPHCFHVIGEHLLCMEHGGESAWTAGAYHWKSKPLDAPRMPIDFRDPWFDFLDYGDKVLSEAIP